MRPSRTITVRFGSTDGAVPVIGIRLTSTKATVPGAPAAGAPCATSDARSRAVGRRNRIVGVMSRERRSHGWSVQRTLGPRQRARPWMRGLSSPRTCGNVRGAYIVARAPLPSRRHTIMRSRRLLLIILALALAGIVLPGAADAQGAAWRAPARTLDIYIADTEGGKAALY